MRYPGQVAHIAAIDVATGEIKNVQEIIGAAGFYVTSLAFDRRSRTLFYTTDDADWRNLVALDLRTGHTTELIHNARIGDLAFNPADSSLWGVRHDNGFSTLVRVPYPYREWNQIKTLDYGRDLFDLDISPDGRTMIASASEVSGAQKLVQYSVAALMRKAATAQTLYDFGDWSPSNFVFSPDGRYLFGSSYYSGVSNVYRYDIAHQQMDALSNTETGFFKPVPVSRDSLVVFAYNRRGFVPSMIPNQVPDSVSAIQFLGNEIAAKRTEVQSWVPARDSGLSIAALDTARHVYRSLSHFSLNSAYPVVEGYQDAAGTNGVAPGVRLNFSDKIGATSLDLTGSYSPNAALPQFERTHLRAVFRSWNWRISAALTRADFYDLFGPTRVSRRGYSLGVQYKKQALTDGPRSLTYTLSAAGYTGLATIPDYQGVAAPFSKLASSSAELAYSSLRKSLGAVDNELGTTASIALRGNYANASLSPRLSLDLERGFLLPINHSSLWFRGSAGTAVGGNRADPFDQFFFGGFGNNWVDYHPFKQFRLTESSPGLPINSIGGPNYAKAQVEWVLPPLRFRRFGIPSFYFQWADLSLFATALRTPLDNTTARRSLGSVGAQLDVRLVTISHLESTFSAGYAAAAEKGSALSHAWMFSFKIM